MSKAVVFNNYGGVEVLKIVDVQIGELGQDDILIKQEAVGVNYHDILLRSGLIKAQDQNNKMLGFEGVGKIQDLGKGVENFTVGQRVAYIDPNPGSYAEYKKINKDLLVAIPDKIDSNLVAATFLKGLAVHSLLYIAYAVRKDDLILVHSAASGIGSIMAKWANSIGVRVIGTVGADEKIAVAEKNGCSYVFNRNKQDWAGEILKITNGRGLRVVYDSVGSKTFLGSIKSLSKFGILVSVGETSGKVANFDINLLREKSLFFSAPSIFDYKSRKEELLLTANEIFRKISNGLFNDQIYRSFSLDEAGKAHSLLQSGSSTNSIVLKI